MILVIGDAPSKLNRDPKIAFKGAACEDRLNAWLSKIGSLDDFKLINRTDPDFETEVFLHFVHGGTIIALGNNASKALKFYKHFKLPHPSGRNRQINNDEFIESKLLECKKFIEKSNV